MRLISGFILVQLLTVQLLAADYYLLEPTRVQFEARNYTGEVHEPYLDPDDRGLRYGGVFTTDFNLVRYRHYSLFMNNKLHFDQSEINGRVVYAGWNFEVGASFRFTEFGPLKIEIGKGHHSQHCLECVRDQHFPVRDWNFIRLNFIP